MSEIPKTVWVTKYALSDGIIECTTVKICDGGYASIQLPKVPFPCTLSRNDYFASREAAVARAQEMRDAKIRSLDKQAKKLREMVF